MEVGGEGDYTGGKGVWRWGEREIIYLSLTLSPPEGFLH